MKINPIPIVAAAAPTPIPALAPIDNPEFLVAAEATIKGIGEDVLVNVSLVDGLKVGDGEVEVISFEGGIPDEDCEE